MSMYVSCVVVVVVVGLLSLVSVYVSCVVVVVG